MSVNANESIHKVHKDALTIVKSSTSLVAAVEQAATHAPYWIDATSYPSKRIPDPLTEPYLDRPGGRGLFLMRTYMTWVSFNQEGNRVTCSRQRSNS